MAAFLCFRLHGAMASWGDVAVGERRPTAPHMSRSAVLGLLAAGLGIRRDDGDAWAELDRDVGFASRTDAPGALLIDFHTAQGPAEKSLRAAESTARRAGVPWHRPATRRAELSFARPALDTLLSSRQYRVDGLWTAAVWLRGESSRWSLQGFSTALMHPEFVLYLGRKSCPVDVPLEPQIIEANDPVTAMERATFRSDEVLSTALPVGKRGMVHWEGDWPGLEPAQTTRRRDRVLSRSRWQFAERDEHHGVWTPEGEERDVPESH